MNTTSHTPMPSSRRRLPLVAAALAIIIGVLAPAVASAQDYPPTAILLAQSATVAQDGVATLNGSGFGATTPITMTLVAGPQLVTATGYAVEAQLAVAEAGVVSTTQTASATLVVLGETTSDANGAFTFAWDTDGYAPGRYTVQASDATLSASTDIIITAAGQPSEPVTAAPPTLPQTGGSGSGLAGIGALVAIAGAALVAISRSRRRHVVGDSAA